MSKCHCGKRMSKYTNECKECHNRKLDAIHAETRRVVANGICPLCGACLRQNLSITGWWYQCEQLGADTHCKDATKPSCDWQGFTQ